MKKNVGLLIAFSLAFFASANESRALPVSCDDGIMVNNIWCKFVLNYQNSGQNVCIGEQYNGQLGGPPLTVFFDIYPAPSNVTPIPKPYRHQTITAVMKPYVYDGRIFGWIIGEAPDSVEKCSLSGWRLAGGKRIKVNPKDVRKSDKPLF
jgi:hypothetical protein